MVGRAGSLDGKEFAKVGYMYKWIGNILCGVVNVGRTYKGIHSRIFSHWSNLKMIVIIMINDYVWAFR